MNSPRKTPIESPAPEPADAANRDFRLGEDDRTRFATEEDASAANARALNRINAIAQDEGVRVVAYVFAELAEGPDSAAATVVGRGTLCTDRDLVSAAGHLAQEPAVINQVWRRMAMREKHEGPMQ